MTANTSEPWRVGAVALTLRVRVTPKGGRDAVDGLTETQDGPALKIRVRAAPEDGEANAAVVQLIADWVGVPRRDVALSAGHKSRVKLLEIAGPPAALEAVLRAKVAALRSA